MATFSIIIPVKPGGDIAALSWLRQMDSALYPFEVLIAEGCSPSRQRNLAAQEAQGDIIYFLDDDSRIGSRCLSVCAEVLTDESVAVVGGPSLTPSEDSMLQQLIGCALSSLLGAGAVRNRYRAVGNIRITSEKELILCNLAIRRSVFVQSGGFDERLYPNEENELLDRISARGLRLIHAPEMAILRSQRRTLRLFIRQMFSYGRGRGQQTLIAGHGTIIGFAPLFLLIYLVLLPFSPINPLTLSPLCCYGIMVLWFSLVALFSAKSLSKALLIPLYPLMHVSNGVGLLCGLLGGKQGRTVKKSHELPVSIRKVKDLAQTDW